MPPLVIAGALAGAGAIGAAAIGSHATSKAAKIQGKATTAQITNANANRDYQYNLNAPTIGQGAAADSTIAGLLNIGGDPAASKASLDTFRGSSGYEGIVKEGLGAVNANAYARGMGRSGATWKALQDRGAGLADRSLQGYLANLAGVSASGGQARGLVAGIGTNTVNSVNGATQTGADARGNATLTNAANLNGTIQNLINAGAYMYGSSYGGGGASTPSYSKVPLPSYAYGRA